MNYLELIKESANKFGLDEQEARDLYRKLCESDEAGSKFAAQTVLDVVKLVAEANQKMQLLASLAEEPEKKTYSAQEVVGHREVDCFQCVDEEDVYIVRLEDRIPRIARAGNHTLYEFVPTPCNKERYVISNLDVARVLSNL